MIVGVPKEIKPQENRVGVVPAGVRDLVTRGHRVLVQKGAGNGSGFTDEEDNAVGAVLVDTAEEVWGTADMVWKVKEPIAPEYPLLREGLVLYTYLHLAPDPQQTKALLDAGVVGIAFETVETADGKLAITYTYPRVSGRLPPGLQRKWERFLTGVKRHEETHARMARQMAKAAEKAMARLAVANDPGCRKARLAAKRRMDVVYADWEARQLAFDTREHRPGGPVERLIEALIRP